jgi:hypothetical protein
VADPLRTVGWSFGWEDVLSEARRVAKRHRLDEDAASEAATIVVERLIRMQPSAVVKPEAYLASALKYEMRRLRTRTVHTHGSETDLDKVVNVEASSDERPPLEVARVRIGLQAAHAAGEHEAVQAAVTWLDLFDELRHEPSLREVAARLRTSHTSVRRRLARLARFM